MYVVGNRLKQTDGDFQTNRLFFLAAEGAALEATICLSGSKEISVPVMHFWVRPCPFC